MQAYVGSAVWCRDAQAPRIGRLAPAGQGHAGACGVQMQRSEERVLHRRTQAFHSASPCPSMPWLAIKCRWNQLEVQLETTRLARDECAGRKGVLLWIKGLCIALIHVQPHIAQRVLLLAGVVCRGGGRPRIGTTAQTESRGTLCGELWCWLV